MLSALADNTLLDLHVSLLFYLFCLIANYMQIVLFKVHLHCTSKTNPLVLSLSDFTLFILPQFF